MSEPYSWPRLDHSYSAYLLVAYPRWVRCLRWIVSKMSKAVFWCETKTARFYDPESGEERL